LERDYSGGLWELLIAIFDFVIKAFLVDFRKEHSTLDPLFAQGISRQIHNGLTGELPIVPVFLGYFFHFRTVGEKLSRIHGQVDS
jgi:hypothetical protein